MKSSTMKKVIRKKIDNWLETINDPHLVTHIKQDIIVTGGVITSMLLGEEINDYDFYFRTKRTTVEVAKYYAEMIGRYRDVCNKKMLYKTPLVTTEMRENIKGDKEERVLFTSGGKQEREEDPLLLERFKEAKAIPVYITENAITLKGDIQLVIRFYGEPSEIHENYDFVHCSCHYDYFTNELILPQAALESILQKNLIYTGSLYPIASVFRLRKFIKRGWSITAGQILKMQFQISGIDLLDLEVLKEQLLGVDRSYMQNFLEALEKRDPKYINADYLANLIDEVFE
jgi:hypothetical protein